MEHSIITYDFEDLECVIFVDIAKYDTLSHVLFLEDYSPFSADMFVCNLLDERICSTLLPIM